MMMRCNQVQVLVFYNNKNHATKQCYRIVVLYLLSTFLCLVTSADTQQQQVQQVLERQQQELLLFQHPKFISDETRFSNDKVGTTNNNNYIQHSYIIKFNDTNIQVLTSNKIVGSSTRDIVYTLMNISTTTTKTSTRNDDDTTTTGVIGWIYTTAFNGFSVTNISIERMIQILDNTIVESATRVSIVTTEAIHDTAFVQRNASQNQSLFKQFNTRWNLDMLVSPYNDNEYHYKYTGNGVQAYIVDGGIDRQNPEFRNNQVKCGWDKKYNTNCFDSNGHGTHVAGIVGSNQYGIAKRVQLISVKVLDNGEGSSDTVIAGIDWIIQQKLKSKNTTNTTTTSPRRTPKTIPMIINLSLGGNYNEYMNLAVQSATDVGIIVVVGAGNGYGTDACTTSPASASSAITVGSIDLNNIVSKFCNRNRTCIDIMAPGQSIRSVKNCDISSAYIPKRLYRYICQLVFPYKVLSGTSMSAPHITGVAALHLQKNNTLNPIDVWNAIQNDARLNVITDPYQYNIPNILISTRSILK